MSDDEILSGPELNGDDASVHDVEADEKMDLQELDAEVTEETHVSASERAKIGPFRRLYLGLTTYDFVGRRKIWFGISAAIIIAGVLSLGFRGLNLGIEFQGGQSWEVLAPGVSQQQVVQAMVQVGLPNPVVEILGGKTVQVQSDLNHLPQAQQQSLTTAATNELAKLGNTSPNNVSQSFVGATWGSQISQKALEALIAFFIAVTIYISIRFEWKMALAALLAVIHDLLVTVGVYSIFAFQVTPDTVIAILTILGYSLYDTVVVFDRVRDNTKPFAASGRMTYSAMVNLSMNQTLARSINTSAVAILPVLSVLVIGAYILGATTLQSYGVALTVGLLSGAYSSIFIASPLLAIMKEREERYRRVRQTLAKKGLLTERISPREAARISMLAPAAQTGSRGRVAAPSAAATATPARTPSPAGAPASGNGSPSRPSSDAVTTSGAPQAPPAITPRARKQKKRR